MHLDLERSLRFSERARKRIDYQKAAISKLRLDHNDHSAILANDLLVSREQRFGLLLEQHGKLVVNANALEASA